MCILTRKSDQLFHAVGVIQTRALIMHTALKQGLSCILALFLLAGCSGIIGHQYTYTNKQGEITELKRFYQYDNKHYAITAQLKKPAELRMGKGKGSIEYWACRVKPGRIMFEVDGVNVNDARKAMTLAAAKLPIKCKFVERNI